VGGVLPHHSIRLPSVSSIIRRTLGSPGLTEWAYNETLAGIARMVSQNPEGISVDNFGVAGDIDAWLTLNGMRPEDYRDTRAAIGNDGHQLLEDLASVQLVKGTSAANSLAENKSKGNPNPGSQIAIGRWWLDRKPEVIVSEGVVFCLEPHGGFAGTLDLVWKSGVGSGGVRTLTDLKTRRAGATSHRSDKLQVGAYQTAWNSMHPKEPIERATILVAREDGTYSESKVPEESSSAFNHLLAVDYLTRSWR